MEELLGTVHDADVRSYLSEALSCYGAGANRACVVLSHIALFDGLKAKLKKSGAVNKVAQSIYAELEKLNDSQAVFETQLIHKMKAEKLITELEAKILEQVNNQRNKAAHPSGHEVSSEEARYVFSEVISKFLSKPLRETSYRVQEIIEKLKDGNFFPDFVASDIALIVESEISDIDPIAFPYLVSALAKAYTSGIDPEADQADSFLLMLASKSDDSLRPSIYQHCIKNLCTNKNRTTFVSSIICCDPILYINADEATKIRLRSMLIHNAKNLKNRRSYTLYAGSEHILVGILEEYGSKALLNEEDAHVDAVIARDTYFANFLRGVSNHPQILTKLLDRWMNNATSGDIGVVEALAKSLPTLSKTLGEIADSEYCFRLLVAIFSTAKLGAEACEALVEKHFSTASTIRRSAREFHLFETSKAAQIVESHELPLTSQEFFEIYLNPKTYRSQFEEKGI